MRADRLTPRPSTARALILGACAALLMTGCGDCDGVELKYEPVDRNNTTASTNNATNNTNTNTFDGARLSLEPVLIAAPGRALPAPWPETILSAIGRDAALVLTLCADPACDTPTLTREVGTMPMRDLLQARFGPLLDLDGLPAGDHHVMLHARANAGDALGLPTDRAPEHLDLLLAGPAPALDAALPDWPTPQTIPVTLRAGEAVDLGKVWLGALADHSPPPLTTADPLPRWAVTTRAAHNLARPDAVALRASADDNATDTWCAAAALPTGDLLLARTDGQLSLATPDTDTLTTLTTRSLASGLEQCALTVISHENNTTRAYLSARDQSGGLAWTITISADGATTARLQTAGDDLVRRATTTARIGDTLVLAIPSTPGDGWTPEGAPARTVLVSWPIGADDALIPADPATLPWRALPDTTQCDQPPTLATARTTDARSLLLVGACDVRWADLSGDSAAGGEQPLSPVGGPDPGALYGARFEAFVWDATARRMWAIPREAATTPLHPGPEAARTDWPRLAAMPLDLDAATGPQVATTPAPDLDDDTTPDPGLNLSFAEDAHALLRWTPSRAAEIQAIPTTTCAAFTATDGALWCLTPQHRLLVWDQTTGRLASPPDHAQHLWADTLASTPRGMPLPGEGEVITLASPPGPLSR